MKKSLLALSLTALFFSCKKETKTEFTATDVTGTTTVYGVCVKEIIKPNGSGNWTTDYTPAAGVLVQIKVNKNQLYPNSYAQGADVYSATTDATGKWSINVKSNANGVQGYLTINGFQGTRDTVVNGVTKTGLYANFFGTTTWQTYIMGNNYNNNVHYFNATNLSNNPNNIQIGTAAVSGSVTTRHILSTKTGTNLPVVIGTTNMPVPAGVTVYLRLDKDPTTLAPKMYTTTTTSNGTYQFTGISTVDAFTSGFNQDADIWVEDYASTQDTIRITDATTVTRITGKSGVYNQVWNFQSSLYTNEVRNGVHFFMNSFTQN